MTAPSQVPEPKKSSRVLESLVLAATPALAYGIALAYEGGVASHFGYPKSFIDVGFGNALVAWGILLSTGVLLSAGLLYLSFVVPNRGAWLLFVLVTQKSGLWVMSAWTTSLLTACLPPRWLWRTVIGILLAMGVAQLLWIAITTFRHRKTGILNRWEVLVSESLSSGIVRGSTFDILTNTPAKARRALYVLVLVSVGLMLIGSARAMGAAQASTQTGFPVLGDSVLILRSYGDYFVGSPIPHDSNNVVASYMLIPRATLTGTRLSVREVGMLNRGRRRVGAGGRGPFCAK